MVDTDTSIVDESTGMQLVLAYARYDHGDAGTEGLLDCAVAAVRDKDGYLCGN
jgi:hypothetical protein